MNIPNCVKTCQNPDLKTAAEIAFVRGTLQEQNECALKCILFNKKMKRDAEPQIIEQTLSRFMRFIEQHLIKPF